MSPRVRTSRALAALLVALLIGGCAGLRLRRDLALPGEMRLYVAVFVDETPEGQVGVPLTEAVRYEVYRRAPARLAMSFDETSFALDGTVTALDETPAGGGRMRLGLTARARLVAIDGEEVAELGVFEVESDYTIARDLEETEERRSDALQQAVLALSRALVDELQSEGVVDG